MASLEFRTILRDYWGAAVLVFGPPVVLGFSAYFSVFVRTRIQDFMSTNWGNVASVWGLLVGFYVLVVAKGAKRAAIATRDREILRTVLEDLEEAGSEIKELGLFAREGKWDIVYIKAVDALSHCRSAIMNWEDPTAPKALKNKLNNATTITRSIADITVNSARPIEVQQRDHILRAQLDVGELLATVKGHVERKRRKVTEP